MCGIAGWFGENSKEMVVNALTKIQHRGRDASGIVDIKKGTIGHNLHATSGRVVQPFVDGDTWFVGNCEIYNWKDLCKKYEIEARNDSELLFKLLNKKGIEIVKELRGPYAFAYGNEKIYLIRDPVGRYPLFYSHNAFASERKAFDGLHELHPRHIWIDGKTKYFRGFEKKKATQKDIDKALRESVKLRIHDDTTLFLSGIDSSLLAYYLKDEGADFKCVTVGLKGSSDFTRAQKVADYLEIKLNKIEITKEQALIAVQTVSRAIESSDPVKVEVGLVTYFSAMNAGKVGFSGLGADELFGGYARMHRSLDKETMWALFNVYERSAYRDNVCGLLAGTEVRMPYLDDKVVNLSLGLNKELKENKSILREIAKNYLGKIADEPKKAAQYGSRFNRVIPTLKTLYLKEFVPKNRRLVALVSGGKDSWYAMNTMQNLNYEVPCAIVMKAKEDSWMFHIPGIEDVPERLATHGVAAIVQETKGEKEKELEDLKTALKTAVRQFGVEGVVSGAISSEYQRDRIEKLADLVGLSSHSPLWGTEPESYLRRLVKEGFVFKIVSVAAQGLDESWVGKTIGKKEVEELITLSRKFKFNAAGEGGEYETQVLRTP